ncbi:tetratricopeptide repeat protein [Haloferula sp.]|uniref:tetratricopeptide repeat protein n=1 Tax=Haloferula sp. TaxID=2497595 RepID=UPI00329EE66F
MTPQISIVALSLLIGGLSPAATTSQMAKTTSTKPTEGDPSDLAVTAFIDGRHDEAVRLAEPLAKKGNSKALLLMGLAYESGNGIEASLKLALENYRKASKAGNLEATYRLAQLLVSTGEEANQKEAQSLLETLAKNDTGNAARILGEGILQGWFGGEADFDKTRSWWERSAEKGDVAAILGLARLLDGEFGFPEKRDPAAALKQYVRAAELGNAPAMTTAGSRYLNGEERIRDEKEGRKWLAKALENKQLDAYLVLGDYAESVTKSDKSAWAEYKLGANGGNGRCMLKVAAFLLEGRGGQQKDPDEALVWFKKAAKSGLIIGHVHAASILLNGEDVNTVEGYTHLVAAAESGLVDVQNELGLLYLAGRLGIRDATAAAGWFRRSASGNFAPGAFNLATLHEQGVGVPQDFDQAGRLYTLAANAGHANSTIALARIYAEGRGTKQNLPKAWALYSLAIERGVEDAKGFLTQVADHLDDDQKKEASKILREMKAEKKDDSPSGGESGK